MAKYIFVTGGVVSGLGKGLTAASLGRKFSKQRGQKVFMQKLDPILTLIQEQCHLINMGKYLLLQMGQKQT